MSDHRLVPGDPAADLHWLEAAIGLSKLCPVSQTAFSVGAVLVSTSGEVIATGYSRESDPYDHAEDVALGKAAALGADLRGATLYSSLEPCLARSSRPVSCAERIVASGVPRVVVAWREPPVFKPGGGDAWLIARGIAVVEFPELARQAKAANAHLLDS